MKEFQDVKLLGLMIKPTTVCPSEVNPGVPRLGEVRVE